MPFRYSDVSNFEAKHPRDKDGQFARARSRTEESSAANKSKKQLKREHAAKSLSEIYGPEIGDKNMKGRRAVFYMLEQRRGHIKGAFHRADLGDIDLVWGDSEIGLHHIIARRSEKG